MSSSFSFPRPTTKTDDLEDLYKVYGVDRTVVLDLAGTTETPETVREGYCGAYLSFFHSCGLNFPIPEPILEILAELGLSFTQILPNFLRYIVVFLVRAREEDLSFGLGEFRHLVLVKRNQQNPSTFLVSPRQGHHIIEDIPYRDEKWREQFFAYKVDQASVGEFDFSQLSRSWAENITPSGSSLMLDEIRGLIGVLRRGRSNWSSFDQTRIRAAFAMPEGTNRASLVGGSEDEAEQSQEVIATPSVQAQSSDRLARQLVRRSSFRTSGSASRNRASGRPTLISIHDSDDEDASEDR
ncbi:meiosis-specific protein ASY2-like [Brassica napus]|uniref:meiosis-specific protein ASY2-like n=1 Tax=Brassica napus TaxID=3708 RepID=UPI0006AAC993|nr:meiosis-specific protein ASY2-like [Brassica napus]